MRHSYQASTLLCAPSPCVKHPQWRRLTLRSPRQLRPRSTLNPYSIVQMATFHPLTFCPSSAWMDRLHRPSPLAPPRSSIRRLPTPRPHFRTSPYLLRALQPALDEGASTERRMHVADQGRGGRGDRAPAQIRHPRINAWRQTTRYRYRYLEG